MRAAFLGACLSAMGLMSAQEIQLGQPDSQAKKQHVVVLSDSLDVQAGSPQVVELRFRINPGFHINSHTPKDELLIPTRLLADKTEAVKILGEDYPAGAAFRLSNGEILDVYQGEFRVRLHLQAPRGTSVLTGSLRYQACDSAACFPPRMLPVRVVVTGK